MRLSSTCEPTATRPRRSSHSAARRGVAVVELSICLPVLFVVVFATIEACSMLYLKQTLKITAYEGARVGIVPSASAADVEAQCDLLLSARNVQDYTVSMIPNDPSTLADGDYLEVTISADYASNSILGGMFYSDKTIVQSVSLYAR